MNIADVVSEHVTLKSAGPGSLKGLCPFHDERSPSFHVRPTLGYYHCFGCGESGDAITFLQRMNHVTFAEAVEQLAASVGVLLVRDEQGTPGDGVNRARLLAANRAAERFFAAQLATPEAALGREFLAQRGFDQAAAATFGVGFAPVGWDALLSHLQGEGFTRDECVLAGLVSQGERGVYDRFRGRLVWPIRDTSGQVLGFGARKLREDDQGPKYLNTPETPVYHKSQVLYGLDVAKRAISASAQAIVVEGYTDVMACHLAGLGTAVATCGTAFGSEHVSLLSRVLGDHTGRGEVIFTFDGDAAGQKAALRAFSEQKNFRAQTFVATAPDGLDPCDLRLQRGDEAVRTMIAKKTPLFEFAFRKLASAYNLDTPAGRAGALEVCAPIVAGVRDVAARPGYVRELAKALGDDPEVVARAVAAVQRGSRGAAAQRGAQASPAERSYRQVAAAPADVQRDWRPPAEPSPPAELPSGAPHPAVPNAEPALSQPHGQVVPFPGEPQVLTPPVRLEDLARDPVTRLERDAVMAMLQHPSLIRPETFTQALGVFLNTPALVAIRDAVAANQPAESTSTWLGRVLAAVPEFALGLASQLVGSPVPARNDAEAARWANAIVVDLIVHDLAETKQMLLRRLRRLESQTGAEGERLQVQISQLEQMRRQLLTD